MSTTPEACPICGLSWHQGREPCAIAQARVIAEQAAVIERLTEALREIADRPSAWVEADDPRRPQTIARAALFPAEDQKP